MILRQAAHNILFAVANSNSLNVKVIGYQTEWWITATYALDVVVAIVLVAWGVCAIKGSKKTQTIENNKTTQKK